MVEKRIMHYRSSHKILLVGEGDFSFSLCLARAFGSAVNMTATSLDSRESLVLKYYGTASTNLIELEGFGCTILHEVDVHNMAQDQRLKNNKFDRIIFNFPHAGFHFLCREFDESQILLHRSLVSGFLQNAKHMLSCQGEEIHISHKTSYPFTEWHIKDLAEKEGLEFIEEVEFQQSFYPGYNNKYGSGYKCSQSFPIGNSSTFKFSKEKFWEEVIDFDM